MTGEETLPAIIATADVNRSREGASTSCINAERGCNGNVASMPRRLEYWLCMVRNAHCPPCSIIWRCLVAPKFTATGIGAAYYYVNPIDSSMIRSRLNGRVAL